MLYKELDDFSHARGHHVGAESKENSAASILSNFGIQILSLVEGWVDWIITQFPAEHFVGDFKSFEELLSLVARCFVGSEQFVPIQTLVEVISLDDMTFGFLWIYLNTIWVIGAEGEGDLLSAFV